MVLTFEQLPDAVAQLHDKLENIKRLLLQKGNEPQTPPDELLTTKKRVKSTQKTSLQKPRKKFQYWKYIKLIIKILAICLKLKDGIVLEDVVDFIELLLDEVLLD